MSKTTKDGMVWYTQGELDAKIIIAEHDREKQTLEEQALLRKDLEEKIVKLESEIRYWKLIKI